MNTTVIDIVSEVENILGYWIGHSDNDHVINFGKWFYTLCINDDDNWITIKQITFNESKNCIYMHLGNISGNYHYYIISIPFDLFDHVLLLNFDRFGIIPME